MLMKKDFIERFAGKGYTKKDAAVIIDDFIETLGEILIEGESIMFRGFGTFEIREHSPRSSIAVDTKERIIIPGFKAPKFTAGKLLKRAINEGPVYDQE